MKNLFTLMALFLIVCHQSLAQKIEQDYQLVKGKNTGQYKNYYLLTLFQELPEVKRILQNDKVLNETLKTKLEKGEAALKNCNDDIQCYSSALRFNDEEIRAIGKRLGELYKPDNELGKLVKKHLIPSGCYVLYDKLDPKEMLIKAWDQDARAINYAIGVYVEGRKPNYPNIDSLQSKVTAKSYPGQVSTNVQLTVNEENQLFFEPSMTFALQAMELDGRNNASDYEPMGSTVNKAAIDQIKRTNWENYKYSIILVPGAGPDDKDTELSAGGILRCRLAAQQYRKGMAPFIVLSGGRVHPYKTKFSEAYEMKKFLMNSLNIPESAIIMEPHARHTTTNMRNGARLIFRYGMPMDKPAITSTVKSQSYYISDTVRERSKKELGYYPYNNGKRLSDTEMEFYPLTTSLQIDFDEPMDP